MKNGLTCLITSAVMCHMQMLCGVDNTPHKFQQLRGAIKTALFQRVKSPQSSNSIKVYKSTNVTLWVRNVDSNNATNNRMEIAK
jgi:hypothetical protein